MGSNLRKKSLAVTQKIETYEGYIQKIKVNANIIRTKHFLTHTATPKQQPLSDLVILYRIKYVHACDKETMFVNTEKIKCTKLSILIYPTIAYLHLVNLSERERDVHPVTSILVTIFFFILKIS